MELGSSLKMIDSYQDDTINELNIIHYIIVL